MRLQVIQHVPFEGPAAIQDWAASRGHSLAMTRVYAGDLFPAVESYDWLIVMGGPMSVHDEAECPWLIQEKEAIQATLHAGRRVLGICLGAQLLATVLGGQVSRGQHKEIGWFPVTAAPDAAGHPLGDIFRKPSDVFHWHGETFSLPDGATWLASSAGCRNQAFAWGGRVVGLQCHLEVTPESVNELIAHCREDLGTGVYEQHPPVLNGEPEQFAAIRQMLDQLLDAMACLP